MTIIQFWFNIVQTCTTLDQHYHNIGQRIVLAVIMVTFDDLEVRLYLAITWHHLLWSLPAKHGTSANVELTLDQRRRRWASVKSTSVQCPVSLSGQAYPQLKINPYPWQQHAPSSFPAFIVLFRFICILAMAIFHQWQCQDQLGQCDWSGWWHVLP